MCVYARLHVTTPPGVRLRLRAPPPLLANSYSKDYDPEDWLQVDGATGRVQTQRVLSPASPFLKDGWYRAIILARDDGERGARPGFQGSLTLAGAPAAAQGLRAGAPQSRLKGWVGALQGQGAHQASPACSLPTQHGHRDPVC